MNILEGIRIIEWSVFQIAPVAGQILGQMGAEIIKLEPPTGDPTRGLKALFGRKLELPNGRHALFEAWNRNKKSIALDLSKPGALRILQQLVKKSDGFIHNYRSRTASKYGLDFKSLRKINPKLIYGSASGFGPKGPDSEIPALDIIGQARSGVMTTTGEADRAVVPATTASADQVAGVMLAFAMVAAFLVRERFGIAQEVSSSLLGGMINTQCSTLAVSLFTGGGYERIQRTHALNPLYNWYRCKDGRYIVLGLLQSDRHWPAFCRAIGAPHLEKDPRFKDMELRKENNSKLIKLLDEAFAQKAYEDWEEALKREDILFSPVNNLKDLPNDSQVIDNKYIVDFEHPVLGRVKMEGFPMTFSESTPIYGGYAPEFGQHTEEVLLDICAYTWEQIDELKGKGVICV